MLGPWMRRKPQGKDDEKGEEDPTERDDWTWTGLQ